MSIDLHSTEMKTWMVNLWKEKAKPMAGEKNQTDGEGRGLFLFEVIKLILDKCPITMWSDQMTWLLCILIPTPSIED